jgi:hypothetical protein
MTAPEGISRVPLTLTEERETWVMLAKADLK